jgi:hypothetical protein
MSDKKLKEVQLQVKEIQSVMQNNIELAIQRGDNLDEMNTRAVLLHEDAKIFSKKSSNLSSQMCWSKYKLYIIIFLIISIIIAFILIVIYSMKN